MAGAAAAFAGPTAAGFAGFFLFYEASDDEGDDDDEDGDDDDCADILREPCEHSVIIPFRWQLATANLCLYYTLPGRKNQAEIVNNRERIPV